MVSKRDSDEDILTAPAQDDSDDCPAVASDSDKEDTTAKKFEERVPVPLLEQPAAKESQAEAAQPA